MIKKKANTLRGKRMLLCECKNTNQQSFKIRKVQVSHLARKEIFKFCMELPVCSVCNNPRVGKEEEEKLQMEANHLYQKKHGLLLPEQIEGFRKQLGLSRNGFAEYLRVIPLTVWFWERKGRAQDRSTDELIRLKCSPEYVSMHSDEINRIKKIKQDDFTGNRGLILENVKNIILYLVRHVQASKLFLNKILFYIDFLHFKKHGVSITGLKYIPLQYGPCPERFQDIFQRLIYEGILIPKEEYEFESTIDPDMSLFGDQELETINYILNLSKNDGGRELYNLSHEEEGFKETLSYHPISYKKYAKKLKI